MEYSIDAWSANSNESHAVLLRRMEQDVWDFFDQISRSSDFEDREGQTNMALEVADIIASQKHLMVEAGVGIGKTFAYLVPAISFRHYFTDSIVIATSTISLQEQLANDIRKLSILMKQPIEPLIVKGQSHFICRQRAITYLASRPGDKRDAIEAHLNAGNADRREYDRIVNEELWQNINIQDFGNRFCQGCHERTDCYFATLRRDMRRSGQIIVCNQDLLIVDRMKRKNAERALLPDDTRLIVIDEAHNLEDKARSRYTVSLTQKYIKRTAEKAIRMLPYERSISPLLRTVDDLFNELSNQIRAQKAAHPDRSHDATRFELLTTETAHKMIQQIADAIVGLNRSCQILSYERMSPAKEATLSDLEYISTAFSDLKEIFQNVIWLEQNGASGTITVFCCPPNIAEKTKGLLFSDDQIIILTSATLTGQKSGSNAERYRYMINGIGFPTDVSIAQLSDPKESPFPYDEHAIIYHADDLPHPNQRDAYIKAGSERIAELLNISLGRALILFTAKSDLDEIHTLLSSMDLPYKILRPHQGASQEDIISDFSSDESSVLLGTGAFWEGVDIPGRTLSNVIIFRLPFPVPDPILERKCASVVDRMNDVLVPEMVIKLKQGVGRLIRNENDKGIISIIDPRLSSAAANQYSQIVWDAMPIKRKTSNLGELNAFYSSVIR